MPLPGSSICARARVLAGVLLLVGAASRPLAGATPLSSRGVVIVLRPAHVNEVTQIALSRVMGELAAARFQVTVLPLDDALDPALQVETAAPESRPVAAFAIAPVTDAERDTIAIWVCDRGGRRTTIQRMALHGDDLGQDAEVLALEAIELIRASIAGLWPVRAPVNPAPPKVASGVPERSAWRPRVSVGLGIAGLKDVGLPSSQWMAALTVTARWPRGLAARGVVAALGPALELSGADGVAEVRRELGSLGVAWFPLSNERLDLFVVMAAGAEHLEVAGASSDPMRGTHTEDAWVPTGSAGIGAAVRLRQPISLYASVDAIWAWSSVDVAIGSRRTEAFSRPGVLAGAGLQATF